MWGSPVGPRTISVQSSPSLRRGLVFRRFRWHFRRIRKQFGGKVLRPLIIASLIAVILGTVAVTLAEGHATWDEFGESFYWSVMAILKAADLSYVTTPWGWATYWFLTLFGYALLAAVTGAVVGFVIDFLIKEGQGMGATEFEGHIVICGWNSTARELIEELRTDEYKVKVVLLHDAEKSPAGRASTSCTATRRAPRISNEPGSNTPRRRSSARPIPQTAPT